MTSNPMCESVCNHQYHVLEFEEDSKLLFILLFLKMKENLRTYNSYSDYDGICPKRIHLLQPYATYERVLSSKPQEGRP